MPQPRRMRPMISILIFCAVAFKIAPRKKLMEPTIMLPPLQPKFPVTQEAANVEIRPAKYSEEVKKM
ncbi:hypothetical protein COLO4_38350 [Corchorus olitorius]|uniref:Uncharacterized protein n=1 Tax=Corchorus olitorius TaxID=93759 RepID=A0A1R3FVF8_9ROSI|nr:hypothetical protein COLO4_38350 [Corchorus olitorius]